MNLLKLITFISILLSGLTYAQGELDNYYALESEVAKLRAEFRDNQGLISEHNTTSNHFWSPSSTKKILDRLHKDQDRILKEMEPKVKEMKKLEQSLEVKAWDYRLGTLEQVSRVLGSVSSNNTCSAQGQQLFTSDKAFEAWNAQNGDLDQKVAYYAQKDGHINNCLNDKKNGDSGKKDYTSAHLCKKVGWWLDSKRGEPVKYKVHKKNGLINIDTSIYFDYKGDEKNRERSFKRLRKAMKCMKSFYAKHGIRLNLTVKEDSGLHDWWSCDHSINIWDEKMNPNSANWTTTTYLSDARVCRHFLHELGHRLGLPDSYPDPDCPDREPIKSRYDMMYSTGSGADVNESNIDGETISKLIRPLCGE
ncbi:hypothetical protein OAT67_03845 [Bacteriovoracaceae bacterium]|nr:hypothetical protein [Bacteriovoracaceae bacterium]